MPRSHKQMRDRSAILLLLVISTSVYGQSTVPRTISHQGLLADASTGDPVTDAAYDVTFRLYEASSGGSPVWTESQSVSTTGGVFNAILGSVASLDGVPFNDELWLSIQVAPDAEMTNRTALTSVPYSLGLALPYAAAVSSSMALLHLDNTGSSDGILVTNSGSGTAGAFIQEDPGSSETGVYGQSNGLGAAVYGQHFGTGNAGRFRIANPFSDAPALLAETDGTGPGAYIKNGRLELEYGGDPHLLIRQTAPAGYARLRMRNVDNVLGYWDVMAGGPENGILQIVRGAGGMLTVMTLRNDGRVGIGVGNPHEMLHVSGNVKADSVVYNSPLHGWVSVNGVGFQPLFQDGTIEYARSNATFHYTTGNVVVANAPIQLPHNAKLEDLTCTIYDLTAIENLTCELCRSTSAGGCTPLGNVTSSGDGGAGAYTAPILGGQIVDNRTWSYYLIVYTEGFTNWATYSDALGVIGVSIGYTVGGAP